MSEENPIEIPLSKHKIHLILLGSLFAVIIGFWFVFNPPKINNPILGNPLFLLVLGVVTIMFFGFTFIFSIKKTQDHKPGLIINPNGIIDNSSAVAAGMILWKDIKEIRVSNVMNQKFLMIVVKNPETYIERQEGVFKRKTMQLNYKTYGSPICISPNALNIEFNDLLELVRQKFDLYK